MYGNPFHSLIAHMASLYRIVSLRSINTEGRGRTFFLNTMSCITDSDGAQDSASGLGAAQSVPLQLTQTDGDAAFFTRIIFLILRRQIS